MDDFLLMAASNRFNPENGEVIMASIQLANKPTPKYRWSSANSGELLKVMARMVAVMMGWMPIQDGMDISTGMTGSSSRTWVMFKLSRR